MYPSADLHLESTSEHTALASFTLARPRRRSRVLPWLLLIVVWSVATALLVVSSETATLIASAAP